MGSELGRSGLGKLGELILGCGLAAPGGRRARLVAAGVGPRYGKIVEPPTAFHLSTVQAYSINFHSAHSRIAVGRRQRSGLHGRKTVKRAMGLIFMVLGFAVVAQADRMAYDGGAVMPSGGEAIGAPARFAAEVGGAILVDDTGRIARDGDTTFSKSEKYAQLTSEVFYSQVNDSAKTDWQSSEHDSIRAVLDGFAGTRDDGRGGRFGVDHPEPFQRFLGVQEIPEPRTLALLGIGLALIAVWKRSSVTGADHSDRSL